MCLNIDTTLHYKVRSNGARKPFVADRPILVWKRLNPCSRSLTPSTENGRPYIGTSPYYSTPYYDGKLMKAKMEFSDSAYYGNSFERFDYVEAGLHSHRVKPYVVGERLCPAVIPAGSNFYISDDGEIASNQLIVYKDMASLEAVHGTPSAGVTVADAVSTFLKVAN